LQPASTVSAISSVLIFKVRIVRGGFDSGSTRDKAAHQPTINSDREHTIDIAGSQSQATQAWMASAPVAKKAADSCCFFALEIKDLGEIEPAT
jgi:hypothetical protein